MENTNLNNSIDSLIDSRFAPINKNLDYIGQEIERGLNRAKQALLDSCNRIHHIDSEDREVVIYYRLVNSPLSGQTDECCDQYTVDRVTHNGVNLPMDKHYENELVQSLNFLNPMQIKF